MTTRIKEDTIKGQWKKQDDSHRAQWNAVVHIGEELGLEFDANGDVTGRTKKEQSVAPSQPSLPSFSKEDMKQAVEEAVRANLPKVTAQPPQSDTLNSANRQVIEALVRELDPVIDGYCKRIREACETAADGRPVRKTRKLQALAGKCWRWFVNDICSSWLKAAAYSIAIICAVFGGCQYYRNHQLLSQLRKDAVIRYVLSGDPANKAMIERIDSLFTAKGAGDKDGMAIPE